MPDRAKAIGGYRLVRPVLFWLPPEYAHHMTLWWFRGNIRFSIFLFGYGLLHFLAWIIFDLGRDSNA